MTTRIVTDSNGRKHITNEPLLHGPMTCNHQWHDATTSAGPEWVCSRCKVKYSDTKKAPPAKREWVGLTDEEIDELVSRFARYELARAIEAKLKELNT